MKVRKAVIPAAGLGTRMLPASKSVPKEMLPLVDRPVIEYIIEEAAASGIEDILVITNRGKSAMEDYFDYAPELEDKLGGRAGLRDSVRRPADLANLFFVRQKETLGLGHAIWRAKRFVGNEPFAILLGDDVMFGAPPVTGQLIAAAEAYDAPCIGIQQVPPEAISKYGCPAVTPLAGRIHAVHDMAEKPRPEEAFSPYAIMGRYILTPDIFDILEQTTPGAGGEIQLTDGLRTLCRRRHMVAADFDAKRYDTGNLCGFLEATLEFSLRHPETGPWLKKYLEEYPR